MILKPGAPVPVRLVEAGLLYSCALPARQRVRWAWLADPHIAADARTEHGGFRPAGQLARVVGEILAVRPDGALVNGDLAWSRGLPHDYQRFRELIRPLGTSLPLVLGVGNHDRRGPLLKVLQGRQQPPPARLLALVDQPPHRFVVLDSQRSPDAVGGELEEAQLRWLDRTLATGQALRTVLFVHHPGESASEGCCDFDALVAVAQAHRQVQAIVTGHDHAFSVGRAGGIHLLSLPAVGFPFEPGTDCGWVEAVLDGGGLDLAFRGATGEVRHRLAWRSP